MRKSIRRAATLATVVVLSTASVAMAEFYADVQFLLLTPNIPSQGFDNIWYRGAPVSVEAEGGLSDSMEYATRVIFGAEDCCGFGGRVRWFSFDNDIGYDGLWDTGVGTIVFSGDTSLDVDAIDLELTQRGQFGYWNILGSAGLRYGRVDMVEGAINFEDAAAFLGGSAGVNFEGVGPTLSLRGSRPVASTGVTLFAVGRSSLLYGDVESRSPFFFGNLFTVRDEIVQVWEFQLGVEYAKTLSNGATVETGIFWETQRWDSENNSLGDLSFMGLGIHTGVLY